MKKGNSESLSFRILKILSLFIIMFIPIIISYYLPGGTSITEADIDRCIASEVIKFYNGISDNYIILLLLPVLLTFIFLPQIDVQRTRKNLFGK